MYCRMKSVWNFRKLARCRLSSVRLAQRARIVLLAAEGMRNQEIARRLGMGRIQVASWRGRYAQRRLTGIERDLPRGAPAKVDGARLVELTTQSPPKAGTHWSTRTMAAELGISAASVSRHWRANGLKPHLVRRFKSPGRTGHRPVSARTYPRRVADLPQEDRSRDAQEPDFTSGPRQLCNP